MSASPRVPLASIAPRESFVPPARTRAATSQRARLRIQLRRALEVRRSAAERRREVPPTHRTLVRFRDRPARAFRRTILALVSCAALLLTSFAASAADRPAKASRVTTEPIVGFTVAPDQSEHRSILYGQRAVQLSNDVWSIHDLRIDNLGPDGKPQTQIRAPQCTWDRGGQTASSPGRIEVHSMDGQSSITGEGFLWNRATSALTISNDVVTIIIKSSTNAPAKAPSPVPSVALVPSTNQTIRITAGELTYSPSSGKATYRHAIHAEDPQLDLRCELMTIALPSNAGAKPGEAPNRIEKIVAEEKVTIIGKQNGVRATGARAEYTEATELLELSGATTWRLGLREGTSDRLTVDGKQNNYHATGAVFLKLPADSVGSLDLWTPTAAAATPAPANTNRFIHLFADDFRSSNDTAAATENAFFSGHVRALEPSETVTNQLTAETLAIRTSGAPPGPKTQTMTAETGVIIESGSRRVLGDHATYMSTTGLLEVAGHARWKMDDREGAADLLTFDRAHGSFQADGNSRTLLPARFLGPEGSLLPVLGAAPRKPSRANDMIEILARESNFRTNSAEFNTDVHLNIPAEGRPTETATCGNVFVQFSPTTNRLESLRAEHQVRFVSLPDPTSTTNGPAAARKLSCEILTAKWNPVTGQLENMIADQAVVIERGDKIARGAHAVYDGALNRLKMTGLPTASSPQADLTETQSLDWDLATDQLTAEGQYKSVFRPKNARLPGALDRSPAPKPSTNAPVRPH